jgi:hypothetical protein
MLRADRRIGLQKARKSAFLVLILHQKTAEQGPNRIARAHGANVLSLL